MRDLPQTIEGRLYISLVEAKGLLMPEEETQVVAIQAGLDSYLELTVEDSAGVVNKDFKTPVIKDDRSYIFG